MRRLLVVLAIATCGLLLVVPPASAAYRGTGDATYYPANEASGSCSYGRLTEVAIAALNQHDYDSGHLCGAHVEVTGPRGTVVVQIMDRCPECAPGDIDLNRAVYDRVADPLAGRVPVSWRVVSPDIATTLAFRYKEGSSQHWCAIQVRNHRNPVSTLEIRDGTTWSCCRAPTTTTSS